MNISIITGFLPTPLRGATKFGTSGGCTSELLTELALPKDIAESIAKWGNMGISKKTWSTYKTAKVMLMKCASETKVNMDLPMTTAKTLAFVDWLARVRKLKGATINSYLAGVRQLHVVRGLDPPVIRTGLVQLVLKGIANNDGIEKRAKNWTGRLPMTKNTMLLFDTLIKKSDLSRQDKSLIWAVSTLAFAGAFRIHEILSKLESTFDPNFTLLTEDVTFSTTNAQTTMHVKLKCPKESKSATPTIVDIFENNSPLCPIKAFKKWASRGPNDNGFPIFRLESGTPLTGSKLNRIMKKLLGPYTNRTVGFFATHSFRIGLASMLGQAGFEDQEIMASGRWSSRVFERYIKLARTRRTAVLRKVSQL